MNPILSQALRPRSLDAMIGCKQLTSAIRGHAKSGRLPLAWLFAGPTGSGKTTAARILATSLQCGHQEVFGRPCLECQKAFSSLDIFEINASEVSGVEAIGRIAQGSAYHPRPPSKYRVYILDESQRLSSDAQGLLLKYVEDTPASTTWIFCTTHPQKLLAALRGRCIYYEMTALKPDGVRSLVQQALHRIQSTKSAEVLADALMDNQIWYPRAVLMAVEKYEAGNPAEKAAQVDAVEVTVDTLKICRLVTDGKWNDVRGLLKLIPADESRGVASAVMGYLSTITLTSDTPRQINAAVLGIDKLSKLAYLDDGMRRPVLMATLYELTQAFSKR